MPDNKPTNSSTSTTNSSTGSNNSTTDTKTNVSTGTTDSSSGMKISTDPKDNSKPANGSTTDSSTGNTKDAGNSTDGPQDQKGVASANSIMNNGVVYPIIRINDHYCIADEIIDFYIESGYYKNYHEYSKSGYPVTGFVPQMKLTLETNSPDLLKTNIVKCGDICAVFFHSGGSMIKSYRADYIITNLITSDKNIENPNKSVTYIISGELWIPNLMNENQKFNFNGTSRDAMYECAKRLGLSMFFCDPDDTDDYMGWVCSVNLRQFAVEVTAHAWKAFNAFFDSWIDPRYGLSFINVNKMLGESGLDEPIDITPFVSTLNNSYGIDGKKVKRPDEEDRKYTKPQAKLLTNVPTEDEAGTPYFISKWSISNYAAEIAKEIGLNRQEMMNMDNPGLDTQSTDLAMSYSIPTNDDKLKNGFYIMSGPGVNLTYLGAAEVDPNQSYVANSTTRVFGQMFTPMSSDDAELMANTGGNMFSSGNVHKCYEAAWNHNMVNNLQLQKQVLEVELFGCNLSVMRGEKIPVLILDYDHVESIARKENVTGSLLQKYMYETACGWFIIDGIKWVWDRTYSKNGRTYWRTKLKLVRREWPIAGYDANVITERDRLYNEMKVKNSSTGTTDSSTGKTTDSSNGSSGSTNNSSTGNNSSTSLPKVSGLEQIPGTIGDIKVDIPDNLSDIFNRTGSSAGSDSDNVAANVLSSYNSVNNSIESRGGVDAAGKAVIGTNAKDRIQAAADDVERNADVPLTGLTDNMKEVFRALKAACPKIKLVSARRWAVDEDGKRVDGNAYVKKNGMFKCVNANGEIMYFKKNNSRHLYGQAFDVINNGISFESLLTDYIMTDQYLLEVMASGGVSVVIEESKDDTGTVSKHYHFGTEKEYIDKFWKAVQIFNPNLNSILRNYVNSILTYNEKALKAAQEIKRNEVEE